MTLDGMDHRCCQYWRVRTVPGYLFFALVSFFFMCTPSQNVLTHTHTRRRFHSPPPPSYVLPALPSLPPPSPLSPLGCYLVLLTFLADNHRPHLSAPEHFGGILASLVGSRNLRPLSEARKAHLKAHPPPSEAPPPSPHRILVDRQLKDLCITLCEKRWVCLLFIFFVNGTWLVSWLIGWSDGFLLVGC